MKFKLFIVLLFFVCNLLPGSSLAQNKVVVIPLLEDAPPLAPFVPVAADSPSNSYFIDNGDGTVTTPVTGLVWQKSDDDTERNWYDASSYCSNNTPSLPGTGWRLPTVDELQSIVDYDTYNPAINGTAFPGTNGSNYWSATASASNASGAWCVVFNVGYVSGSYKAGTGYVRCVR